MTCQFHADAEAMNEFGNNNTRVILEMRCSGILNECSNATVTRECRSVGVACKKKLSKSL